MEGVSEDQVLARQPDRAWRDRAPLPFSMEGQLEGKRVARGRIAMTPVRVMGEGESHWPDERRTPTIVGAADLGKDSGNGPVSRSCWSMIIVDHLYILTSIAVLRDSAVERSCHASKLELESSLTLDWSSGVSFESRNKPFYQHRNL